jgi:dienelactone hydrolase
VVWNHGSERLPGSQDGLGRFFASKGYVFFIPHRHGHGRSPGDYALEDLRARAEPSNVIDLVIELQESYLKDTIAATRWLERQPFADPARLAMSGASHGGVQTVLAAEADAGVDAYVPFAPGAMAWDGHPELHDRLLRAVRQARAPMFLLQAENDYSLGPSEVLGEELRRKGGPNRAQVYPPYGRTHQSGHGAFACQATDVWGGDVCAFLDEVLKPPP